MSTKNYLEEDRKKARMIMRRTDETEAMLKVYGTLSHVDGLFKGICALATPDTLDAHATAAVMKLADLGSELITTMQREFEEYRKVSARVLVED